MTKISNNIKKVLNLNGLRIVLTRSKEQSNELRTKLEALGAMVIDLPLIKISPYCDPIAIDEVFSELGSYEWIIFTSRNGVQHFFDFFFHKFKDIRSIGGIKIACVGQGTAEEIEKYHLEVDFMPEEALSENLADGLIENQSLDSTKILVITGNLNRDTLKESLENKGHAIVDTLQVYETKLTNLADDKDAQLFRKEGADVIVFASSSAVNSFVQQAQSLQIESSAKKALICSIGPVTSQTIKDFGLSVSIEAKNHTIDGIVEILLERFGH